MVRIVNFGKTIAFKFYLIIVLASALVVALGVDLYIDAKNQMSELSRQNKIAATRNIVQAFGTWLDERTHALLLISHMIEDSNALTNEEQLKRMLKTLFENSPDFDAVQLLREDGEIYVNGEQIINPKTRPLRTGLIWHFETKATEAPTINFVPQHSMLKSSTINICVPNHKSGHYAATLCGIVQLDNIFNKVKNFNLAPNIYTFIVSHGGEIITPMSNIALKERIEAKFKEVLLESEDLHELNIDSNFIALGQIYLLNWYIGVGADDTAETTQLLRIFQGSAMMLLMCFGALILVANILHSLMYRHIKLKKDEYEILLAHKARMSEAGELISGINHQFIQPVNSLNLMIKSILMLEREGNLDRETMKQMLLSGESSLQLLSDTIEIFRSFYRASDDAEEFGLRTSIKNLLTLMHTELSRANVRVALGEFEDMSLLQRQNVFQQVLLILLHNAKDAVVDKFSDLASRVIYIDAGVCEQIGYVRVRDYGAGVADAVARKIFAEPRTTKQSGNGIGLYFGKRLAIEKLGGDLRLISQRKPTTFELNFKIRL